MPSPPSMSGSDSGFCRFTVAPPERDCSGAHARSLARCLPWALAHQCRMYNGTSRADADGFVRLIPCASWRLGLPARSDGFFIPYRVPIRVPYGQHDGQRANLSAGGSSQQYRPATLGPGHRATIVWLHLGPGHRAAVLLSAWRYPWALPRRYGKHQKLYREDSPYSIIQYGSAPARLCPRSQRQAAQFHLHYSRWLSPSRCHQKC
jgi:hypothetical protein